jgi:hypothetical protein
MGRETPHSKGAGHGLVFGLSDKEKRKNERIIIMTRNNVVVAIYKSHAES